jgi:Kef-type K+ transport system membrane component KefB
MEVFIEISVITAITVVIAGLLRLLKQPLIIGYILTGIVVGPSFLNLVKSSETMGIFAHIGIALLLFTIGLGLDPKIIKYVGKVSLITGLGQVLFTSVVGFFIAGALGFSTIVSLYIAIALTFSSTIIIMKLLSDKGDTETLYGKIAIGFLLVQDIVVILVLMVVSSLSEGFSASSLAFDFIIKGMGLLGAIFLIGIYLLPRIINAIAKSQEFLFLFSFSWCLALASLSYYVGFSIEIGALLAGVTLAMSPYRYEISSKMSPLRDFFIVLFFILLGSQMIFADISQHIVPIVAFSAFILIGNPLIVIALMGLLGYTKRNSFLAGLTVAQISEFSLILIALGVKVGHVTSEILSLVTAVGLITITGSTYLILYADKIYPYLSRGLSLFEKKGKKVDEHIYHEEGEYNAILFGCNRIGSDILGAFEKIQQKLLVVDYDPETIRKLAEEEVNCRYGDANDSEMLGALNFAKIKMAVSTIPKLETNLLLINKIREVNSKAIIVVVSHQADEALQLYNAGAVYVLLPHFLGGHHISDMIKKNGLNTGKFFEAKKKHIKHLSKK